MTTLLMLKLALVPAMSWLDRQRGTPRAIEILSKIVALTLLGYTSAVLLGHAFDPLTLLIVAAVAFAYNMPGFGQPIGAILSPPGNENYETWQTSPALRTNPTLALVFYGLFFPYALLVLWAIVLFAAWFMHAHLSVWIALWPEILAAGIKLALAYSVAFAAAPHLAVKLDARDGSTWATQEYLRGAIAATLLFIGGLI